MLNTYAGLTVPLIASATATFLFRQFFLTVPDELVEAARMDGAGPMRFFKDILVPLSQTSIAALFVIQFIYGWNQYLWPLLATTSEDMYPVVIGIKRMIAGGDAANDWNIVMATAILAHAAAGHRGGADAEVVRQGPGGYREITQEASTWQPSPFATSSSATATGRRPTRSSTASAPRSPTASSSSSSGPRAAASPRCCAWSRGWRKSAPARSPSATAWSTTSSRPSATSRWCSRTTRSIRT